MPKTARYSIDTSSLIAAWFERYPIRHFGPFWQRMEHALDHGLIVVGREVYSEVKRKDDDLFAWLKNHNTSVVEIDNATQQHARTIMTAYPSWSTSGKKSGADPWVIALAMAHNPKLTVITEEGRDGNVKRPKIPFVCEQPEIQLVCLNIVGLIREEDWIF